MVASHVSPTGDLACNPGMRPDWELNWWPFGSQADAQSTEPHQLGQGKGLFKARIYEKIFYNFFSKLRSMFLSCMLYSFLYYSSNFNNYNYNWINENYTNHRKTKVMMKGYQHTIGYNKNIILKKKIPGWCYLVGWGSINQKVLGLIPHQGTCLRCWFGLQLEHIREATDRCFYKGVPPPPSPTISVSFGEGKKKIIINKGKIKNKISRPCKLVKTD